ncbi:MAG: hypothetical protein NVSMB46_07190 [Candidatus Saccharimonadales bacterium]
MREKHYIEWIYSTDFIEKTKPAIYYLGINGIRYFKSLGTHPLIEIQKRYKESKRSRSYIEHSMLVADCCFQLQQANTLLTKYTITTESDYMDPAHKFHFLANHDLLRPNLCVVKFDYNRNKDDPSITHYLLENINASLPRYRLRSRFKAYISYLDLGEWEGGKPQPIVLLIVPTLIDLIYSKRLTERLFENLYADEDESHIRFITAQQVQKSGITTKIWEEGRLLKSM